MSEILSSLCTKLSQTIANLVTVHTAFLPQGHQTPPSPLLCPEDTPFWRLRLHFSIIATFKNHLRSELQDFANTNATQPVKSQKTMNIIFSISNICDIPIHCWSKMQLWFIWQHSLKGFSFTSARTQKFSLARRFPFPPTHICTLSCFFLLDLSFFCVKYPDLLWAPVNT